MIFLIIISHFIALFYRQEIAPPTIPRLAPPMIPTIPPGTPAVAPAAKPPKKLLTQLFPPYTRVNSSVKVTNLFSMITILHFFIEPNNTI